MPVSPGMLTDRYELTMLASFVQDGSVAHPGVFEAFARRLPEGRRYGMLAGLGRLVSKKQMVDALKATALALIVGSIGGFYLKSHVEEFSGVLAMPLPAAIGSAADTLLGGLALSLADAAADKAARAHAEREADGLFQQDQREACADGGGERRIPPGKDERFEQLAGGGSEHGGDAGRGDFQRQRADVAGKQMGLRHGAASFPQKRRVSFNMI